MLRSPFATVRNEEFQVGADVVVDGSFIHPTATIGEGVILGDGVRINAFVVIDDETEIGNDVEIGPHVSIGAMVRIGCGTVICPHVTIREQVRIGNNVTINSGTVIGSDGFGFANASGLNHKIPQTGTIEIEDDAWIGSNVTIDRATLGCTYVRRGACIDNLAQIGHNVDIGERAVIRSQVGIAGSTSIGAGSSIGEKVGVIGHLEIGNNVTVHPFSGLTKGLSDGREVMGTPAKPIETEKSIQTSVQELPDMVRDLTRLKRKMNSERQ